MTDAIFKILKGGLMLAGIAFLLAATKAEQDRSEAEQSVSYSLQSIAGDVHISSQALGSRLGKLDPLLVQAETDLKSLDVAIRTHRAATNRASNELHGSFQNVNAALIQAGLWNDEVRQASIEQRASLEATNKQLLADLVEFNGLVKDARAAVSDPAIHATLTDVSSSAHQINDTIYELRHPPKQTRGQRALKFIIQAIFGNAVQGAVRR